MLDAVSGELIDVNWPVRPRYTRRNKAWLASAIMIAVAALLPVQFAAPAVVVVRSLRLTRSSTGSGKSIASVVHVFPPSPDVIAAILQWA